MSTTPLKTARPLSPHLLIYKKQLTSGMSIFHRITGVGLTFGLPVFVIWLMALARGPNYYAMVMGLLRTTVGQILLFGWTWAFFYHFCNGVRHLIWDAGKMLSLKAVYISGYITLALSVVMTALLWLTAHGYLP